MICACPEIKNIEAQQEAISKKYIYVLLLRYPDTFSKIFRFISRCRFNHASIGVSESDGIFYSYVTKGFRKELPIEHPTFKQKEVPCKLYRVEVSDEIHGVTKATLKDHAKQAHNYKYNNLGLALCLLHVVYPFRNKFFCSQFVSEILADMKAVPLEKHCSLYLPDDFENMKGLDLCFSGYLSQLVRHPKPAAFLAV